MNRRRVVTSLAAIAAVLALGTAELLTSRGDSSSPRAAPGLPAEVLSGPAVDMNSLRGRPAIVNFWASWCAPCRQEAPELERLATRFRGRVAVVGVDWGDSADGARAFIDRYDLSYPMLRDGANEIGTKWGLAGLPTTFVLNSRGQIAATLSGPQTVATLRRAIQAVETSADHPAVGST